MLALTLSFFFFAAGNFGFLNVFDIRRESQVLLILLLLPTIPRVLKSAGWWLREPLWWMIAVIVIAEMITRQNQTVFFLFDRIASLYVVAVVFSCSDHLADKVLKNIVTLSAVFSVMVIIQAAIVWTDPEVLYSFVRGYTSSTQADPVELGHPLEYLGFVSPGILNVMGHDFARFRSFTSEPSAVICAFLVPGILALGYRGVVRLAAAPILLFAGFLSGSGTVFLSIALGVAAYPMLLFFKRRGWILSLLPFLLIPLWYIFVATTDVGSFAASLSEALAPVADDYGALNKTVSGTVRLSIMSGYLGDYKQYLLLGSPIGAAGGLLLHMLLYAGITGFVLAVLVSYRILRSSVFLFARSGGTTRIMCALFYGTFLQVLSFSEYGWMSLPGFMLLGLVTRKFVIVRDERLGPARAPGRAVPSPADLSLQSA